MKDFLSLAAVALVGLASCTKVETLEKVPRCIEKEIKEYEEWADPNIPQRVWRYTYKGQTVYFFPVPGCCDQSSVLYNEDCNPICAPDGGFSGGGDGKCPDFDSTKRDEVLVWKNDK
jgi:hypothetical protein